MSVIAERYGTNVQTLAQGRTLNWPAYETITSVEGETRSTCWLVSIGTTVEPCVNLQPELLRADGHLVLEGDTLARAR